MSLPAGLPKFFVDRSVGRLKVPTTLRAAGLDLVTLAEHYGTPQDENVADVDWLELAGRNGWPVLMKDAAIATNPAKIMTVRRFGVQCFTLTRQDLPAYRMTAWFLNNLDRIAGALGAPGPYIYGVEETTIKVLA